MMTPRAKADAYQSLAKRLKALGADVGDVDAITHDDRSFMVVLTAIVGRLESAARERAKV